MGVAILNGDVRTVLATLPSDYFDCVVTSPPYWGLRDYGVAGQIGLEPTLADYLDVMTSVCRELRRVLKPTGTFWLNIGDSYAGNPGGYQGKSGERFSRTFTAKTNTPKRGHDLKPKDLCMVPNRLAIRLQEDGWFVRSEIIWHKPNPMPESVTDRPTSSHEKVWLLTKSERYAYDADAVREPLQTDPKENYPARAKITGRGLQGYADARGGDRDKSGGFPPVEGGRNLRNVWSIASQPFSGAHFATMPPDLVDRCIKAGCPKGGHVLDPFGGAGTTGLAADRLGRQATLIELNPAYVEIARNRIEGDAPLLAKVE